MQLEKFSSKEEAIAIFLGGLIGFVASLIVLLLAMGSKLQEPFVVYWLNDQSSTFAFIVITSFVTIGCLVAYMKNQLTQKEKEVVTLKETIQDLNEFIAVVIHQMRTPLSSARYITNMLLKGYFGKISEEQKKFLQRAYGNLENLALVTQDLFDVTKLGLAGLGFSLRYISLQEIEKNIQEVIQKFIPIAKTKDITITLSFGLHHNKFIHIDWKRISQVIENLLENAINYTPAGGNVNVQVTDNESTFLLSVSDNGIGIPQEEQQAIFGKFFRASNARKKEVSGTGIGLYLCKQIINAHHGKSWFVSQEGRGTTFYFSLPIAVTLTPEIREVEELLIKI